MTQTAAKIQISKFDPHMYRAALAYCGLPQDYRRTFKSVQKTNRETGEKFSTLYSCDAAKESRQGLAVWVQVNIPHKDAAMYKGYPKKASNEDIQRYQNLTLDYEYPQEPQRAHRVSIALLAFLIKQGLAEPGAAGEDTGGGGHIVLPLPAIEVTRETAKQWNEAVRFVVKQHIQPEFARLVAQEHLEIDLEGYDLSRVLSLPGTWRPTNSEKPDCEQLQAGYLRRWLPPYTDGRYPERKESAHLKALIEEAYKSLSTQQHSFPVQIETSSDRARWLQEYAARNPNNDRSDHFQSLVNAVYLKYDEQTVWALKDEINLLTGEKYNGRLETELQRSLEKARTLPKDEKRTQEYRPAPRAPLAGSNGNGAHADDTPDVGNNRRSFNRTDMGNAERLIARYGDRLRYCHAMNNWMVWTGKQWKEDKDGQAERLAKDTVRAIYFEAGEEVEEQERKSLGAHAIKSESKARIRDMLILAQSEPGVPLQRDELDANPWLLNCINGTIDLYTGQLRPHNRADLLTKCLVTPYQPDATCPRWLAFLHTIFAGNTAIITFIQRALGYALTGDTSEQCFFLFYGTGQNGKSTLLEVVQGILEDYAQAAEFKAFLARDNEGIRNDIARMNGKRMVIAKESDKGRRLAEAMIKSLTGGDTITARFLHQEYFDFRPQFKLFLAANHKPEIKGTDLGIWRRVRLVPFTVTIPEAQKDKDLPRKLREEAAGILAWMIQGCLDWQREGLGLPEVVRSATDSYRAEMDVIARFLSESCQSSEGEKVGSSALLKAYEDWCNDNGERYDAKQLRLALQERGYQSKRGTGGRYVWHGIALRESEPATEESEPDSSQFERKSELVNPSEPKNGNFPHEDRFKGKLPKNGSLGFTSSLSAKEIDDLLARVDALLIKQGPEKPFWRHKLNGYAPGNIPRQDYLARLRALLTGGDAKAYQDAMLDIEKRLERE